MFQGSIVALITPMNAAGELDEDSLGALIEKHIAAGTSAVLVNGTTGEAATLTSAEKGRIIQVALEAAKHRIPILAGTGTHSTAETIRQTQQAMELGADACVVITPYCVRPTQEGLYEHYRLLAQTVPIPIIPYNVPKRTGCDLLPETIERLSHISNIIGVKDATGDLARGKETLALCEHRIALYSGDDASALAFMLQGGKGVISVTANVAPKAMHDMCMAALSSNLKLAGELNTPLMELHKNLFVEANPIPVKWVAEQLGWIKPGIRLPLTSLSEKYHAQLREAMKISGVV